MVLKWYIKSINGYLRYKSVELHNIIKVDDYMVDNEPRAAIAVSDKKGRGEIIQCARYTDRDMLFDKINLNKDNQEMMIEYTDLYPSVITDEEAFYELAKHRASLLDVPRLIHSINAPNVMLLYAVKIIRQDRAKLFLNGKLSDINDLIVTRNFEHVQSPVHFLTSVWTLTLPIPKKYVRYINANQYFDYVCRPLS